MCLVKLPWRHPENNQQNLPPFNSKTFHKILVIPTFPGLLFFLKVFMIVLNSSPLFFFFFTCIVVYQFLTLLGYSCWKIKTRLYYMKRNHFLKHLDFSSATRAFYKVLFRSCVANVELKYHPMNHCSVDNALKMEPGVHNKFSWILHTLIRSQLASTDALVVHVTF